MPAGLTGVRHPWPPSSADPPGTAVRRPHLRIPIEHGAALTRQDDAHQRGTIPMAHATIAHPTHDDVFLTLRAIEMLRRVGTITEPQYQRAFAMLNSAAGVPCRCGAVPALITPSDGGPALCARCALGTR